VPLLEDALREFPRLFFDLEVKAPEAGRPTVELVERLGMADRVVVTSFRHDLIAGLAGTTHVPLGLILSHRPADLAGEFLPGWHRRPGVRTLAVAFEVADDALVRTVHEAGFAIFLWGLSSPADRTEAAAWSPTALVID
jgi:hypothetical protein